LTLLIKLSLFLLRVPLLEIELGLDVGEDDVDRGKNDFLGVAYLVVGAICLLLAAAFGLKHHFSPRPLGDMKYFNWPGIGRGNAARS